jgi:hypothetical protein
MSSLLIALGPESPEHVLASFFIGGAQGEEDLSQLVPEGQKACPFGLLCREGLLYFQELARPRKPRTQGSPPAAE